MSTFFIHDYFRCSKTPRFFQIKRAHCRCHSYLMIQPTLSISSAHNMHIPSTIPFPSLIHIHHPITIIDTNASQPRIHRTQRHLDAKVNPADITTFPVHHHPPLHPLHYPNPNYSPPLPPYAGPPPSHSVL
jgi:hypothetical protein